MMAVLPCSAAFVPMCRPAGFSLSAYWIGWAEWHEGAEGKIKETGTTLAGFLKLLLSAHWLGKPGTAPCFLTYSAAPSHNTLSLLDFDRHHGLKLAVFRGPDPEARL